MPLNREVISYPTKLCFAKSRLLELFYIHEARSAQRTSAANTLGNMASMRASLLCYQRIAQLLCCMLPCMQNETSKADFCCPPSLFAAAWKRILSAASGILYICDTGAAVVHSCQTMTGVSCLDSRLLLTGLRLVPIAWLQVSAAMIH